MAISPFSTTVSKADVQAYLVEARRRRRPNAQRFPGSIFRRRRTLAEQILEEIQFRDHATKRS